MNEQSKNLKLFAEKSMKTQKRVKVLKIEQKNWLKACIHLNTEIKSKAEKEFQENNCQSMN